MVGSGATIIAVTVLVSTLGADAAVILTIAPVLSRWRGWPAVSPLRRPSNATARMSPSLV
jgi:hypothetical protein